MQLHDTHTTQPFYKGADLLQSPVIASQVNCLMKPACVSKERENGPRGFS